MGKAIEITVAGTAVMVAKHKGLIDAEMHPNFKEDTFTENQKRAKRKRLAR
ncbi:DUF3042 family protein [Lactococcus formosensis]|uniref:DUF3042 family protein n=1 Tax=Lactococcus formosensis TaxID=1281486 RepID=UPI0032668D4A